VQCRTCASLRNLLNRARTRQKDGRGTRTSEQLLQCPQAPQSNQHQTHSDPWLSPCIRRTKRAEFNYSFLRLSSSKHIARTVRSNNNYTYPINTCKKKNLGRRGLPGHLGIIRALRPCFWPHELASPLSFSLWASRLILGLNPANTRWSTIKCLQSIIRHDIIRAVKATVKATLVVLDTKKKKTKPR
jgi:hypothetical protein